MDKQFLKELKNKREAYTKSFVKIKDMHEWDTFISHVKQELLDNPDQTTIGISTSNDYWPRSQSGDLIKPKNLAFALQHELRLKCEYNDSNVIISTQQRVYWWKYLSPILESILAGVFVIGIVVLGDSIKLNVWIQTTLACLAIILLLFAVFCTIAMPDSIFTKTKYQEKKLFGK